MIALVDAYDRSDIHQFEKLLRENKKAIMDDDFVRGYVEDLVRMLFDLRYFLFSL